MRVPDKPEDCIVVGDRAVEALRELLAADVAPLPRFHHRAVDVRGE